MTPHEGLLPLFLYYYYRNLLVLRAEVEQFVFSKHLLTTKEIYFM